MAKLGGWLAGWLVGWLADLGQVAGWLVGWLAGWPIYTSNKKTPTMNSML